MSENNIQAEEGEWTKANLQKLLAALKTGIPMKVREKSYSTGMKAVDWKQVAFPPFSAEACQEKWTDILKRMRKTRTLTELVEEAEGVIDDPRKSKISKKIHPDTLKKPGPPYTFFYTEKCAKYRKKHPDMTSRKLMRALAAKYKKLPDEKKALYEEKHQLACEEYFLKMNEFSKKYSLPFPAIKQKKRRKWVSEGIRDQDEERCEDEDGLPPKPPYNGFNLFHMEQVSEEGDRSRTSKELGQQWRDLTEEQRNEYNHRCRKFRQEYAVKLDAYLSKFDKKTQDQIIEKHQIKRPKNSKLLKKFPGEPTMPPRAGNATFYKSCEQGSQNGAASPLTGVLKMNQMWKQLSKAEKERYKLIAERNLKTYTKELQKWYQELTPEQQKDYLEHNPRKKYLKECISSGEHQSHRPSDSEDEYIESSSSEEEDEEEDFEYEEVKGGDDIMFEIF